MKNDEAREGLCHTGAAGQDNLPSVLSGFTPVLLLTPETPLIYCGEGRQRRGRNHLWSIAHRQASRWAPDLPCSLILLNPSQQPHAIFQWDPTTASPLLVMQWIFYLIK